MGLIGTFTKKIWYQSDTELEEIEVSYKDDLPEWHVNYTKRGITEILTRPKFILQEESFVDAYINILDMKLRKMDQGFVLAFTYLIYNSKQDRIDGNDYIGTVQAGTILLNGDEQENFIVLCYKNIKETINFESVIDD